MQSSDETMFDRLARALISYATLETSTNSCILERAEIEPVGMCHWQSEPK